MNSNIANYFDQIEARFLASPVIQTFRIVRREIAPASGILRIEANLIDAGFGEFFEYALEIDSQCQSSCVKMIMVQIVINMYSIY